MWQIVLEKKILKVFAIYGHDGDLDHVTNTILYKFMFPNHIEASHNIWIWLAKPSQENILENNGLIHAYSPGAGADNPYGSNNFQKT